MSTNDELETPEAPTEEVSTDAVADLQQAKAEAEAKPQTTETEQVAQSTEPAEAEGTKEPEATLTTEPEHDLDWYKKAYEESTKEGLRLKGELDKKVDTPPTDITPPTDEVLTPEQLYIRGKISEETTAAFNEVSDKYPALKEKETYDRFVAQAEFVGRVIKESEKRFPTPKELYEKTAVILGLTPDNSDVVSSTLRDAAASPRTSSVPAAPASPSKVSEEMIAANLKMYPRKTREEIIKELEPHIN